jgi:hypothetical protein
MYIPRSKEWWKIGIARENIRVTLIKATRRAKQRKGTMNEKKEKKIEKKEKKTKRRLVRNRVYYSI